MSCRIFIFIFIFKKRGEQKSLFLACWSGSSVTVNYVSESQSSSRSHYLESRPLYEAFPLVLSNLSSTLSGFWPFATLVMLVRLNQIRNLLNLVSTSRLYRFRCLNLFEFWKPGSVFVHAVLLLKLKPLSCFFFHFISYMCAHNY